MKKILSFLILLLPYFLSAQHLEGKVIDAETGENLAFVNIYFENSACGTSSDIDGYFKLSCSPSALAKSIHFSYIGYETLSIPLASFQNNQTVELTKNQLQLNEVVLIAKANPAHRIIKKAAKNRDLHKPENYKSFQYQSYNKLLVTVDKENIEDSILQAPDTSLEQVLEFFNDKHLLLLESVTERKFLSPNNDHEKILASRVSGLQNPMFNLLANQFQSFGFHDDYVEVLEQKYLNPISKGAESRYVFELKDTLYRSTDTVYVITFQPSIKAKFKGLKGFVSINTNGYAIENIIAEPAAQTATEIKIQQAFKQVDGYWFPHQLNTNLLLKSVKLNNTSPIGIGRSYIKNIKVNHELSAADFPSLELEVENEANTRTEAYWQEQRVEQLDSNELNTYTFIDSIGEAEKFEQKLYLLQALLSSELPLGKLSFDLNRLTGFNQYEGIKLGAGLKTNQKFSDKFGLGAWIQYGFNDKRFKYGGDVWALLYRPKLLKAFAKYRWDIVESAGMQTVFHQDHILFKNYRYWNLDEHVDVLDQKMIGFTAFPNSKVEMHLSFDQQSRNPQFNYQIKDDTLRTWYPLNSFRFAMQYRPKDKKMMSPFGLVNFGQYWPNLVVDFTHAPAVLNKEAVSRLIIVADFRKQWTRIGKTDAKVFLGKTSYQAPLPFQLAGYGARGAEGVLTNLAADMAFETMGFGEVVAPGLASLYMIHDMGPLFGKASWTDYGVRLHAGVLYSEKLALIHEQMNSHDASRGYYETGLSFRNLFSSFGFGAYYRLGYYAMPNWENNLSLKLHIALSL